MSTINSVYDPLGFLAPVLIKGKLMLRELTGGNVDWDEALPQSKFEEWESWEKSLHQLEAVKIPRMCLSKALSVTDDMKLHIFSDASEKAIAAVAHLVSEKHSSIGFVPGKAKVAPTHGHTIPRLELCTAVLATEIGQTVSDNLNIPINSIQYHTDSKVVLGYISNEKRRFYTYVSNRVAKIRHLSHAPQWNYVPTDKNPADLATRAVSADEFQHCSWLLGPKHLLENKTFSEKFERQNPDEDKEIRPEITCAKLVASKDSLLGTQRFQRVSCWNRLVNAVSYLKQFLVTRTKLAEKVYLQTTEEAERLIIKEVQTKAFLDEMECIKLNKRLSKESKITNLDPFMDDHGLLRVGGRLRNARLPADERHPVIIPGKHHISLLLVRHFHKQTKHQGRHFTSGAVRSAGYWIIGEKRLVSSVLQKCVVCRK